MTTLLATDALWIIVTDDGLAIEIVGDVPAPRVAVAASEKSLANVYAGQVSDLHPPGIVFSSAPDSVVSRMQAAFSAGLARVHQRADDLLEELDPRTTWEMLSNWESQLGLPDPCVGADGTAIERRNAVVAREVYRGGQSIVFLIGLAAHLGFTITIEEYRPWRVGTSSVLDPLMGDAWAYAFTVHAPLTTITSEWTVGLSPITDPLRSWGNWLLECAMRRAAPAHTVLRVIYDLEV